MLTYTNDETQVSFSVKFDRWDALQNDRARWAWTISCAGTELATGDDLTTVGDPDETEALRALQSFLSAWEESWQYGGSSGENADLFPYSLRLLRIDWQSTVDEFGMSIGSYADR